MRPLFFLEAFWLFPKAFAAFSHAYVVHEKRAPALGDWTKSKTLPNPTMPLALTVALMPDHLAEAEEYLLHSSDPGSPMYGHHWTAQEVARKFSPGLPIINAALGWLRQHGIGADRISRSNDATLLFVNTTISEAESLLGTKYAFFESPTRAEMHIGCDHYSLPASITSSVQFISPTVHLGVGTGLSTITKTGISITRRTPAVRQKAQHTSLSTGLAAENDCTQFMNPICLRQLYGIPTINETHPSNSIGIYEQAWVSWLPEDLDGFFNIYSPSLNGSRPVMVPIDGGFWQDRVKAFPFNAEADLDFEYAMTLTAPQPVIDYQVGDIWGMGNMNTLLAAFDNRYCGALNTTIDGAYPDPYPGGYNASDCGIVAPAHVISLSYAWNEAVLPPPYLQRQCQEFLKLALQGVTVIVSSADCGVAGQNCECVDPYTHESNGATDHGAFNPTSPAVCPYVTAVGGTQFAANHSRTEVAFRVTNADGTVSSSGGGFSWVFDAPAWQREAAASYLVGQRYDANFTQKFNPRGRGVPDVAVHAANYVTVIDGSTTLVQGTSASAPVFASIVALINNARLMSGKGPVGFINPVLYTNPHSFNDVTDGTNQGCGVEGFAATTGWDPVTGLGTPDYQRLSDVFLRLP